MKGVRVAELARHLSRHPADVVVLARAGWRLRRAQWLRRAPFLPLPDAHYWHFRMVTVSGDSGGALAPAAMVEAARWAVAQPIGRRA